MSSQFLSSEEYDDRAHTLYNEGQYAEALDLLREGLARYPEAVDLHVGVGYARMARDEFAWARRAFERGLAIDAEHEDALAGLGEVLLKFGEVEQGMQHFEKTVELGYEDDVDLMLQIGRALFREGYIEDALAFFERGAAHAPDSAEAVACVGYAHHRLGRDAEAMTTLQRALSLDENFAEARVYLANLLYDAGASDASLAEFDRTVPADHWDELGIWRLMDLKKAAHNLSDDAPELAPWGDRLSELNEDVDPVDELLAEIEQQFSDQESEAANVAQGQLETLGTLLTGYAQQQSDAHASAAHSPDGVHRVVLGDGRAFDGTWEEIVRALRDARSDVRPVHEFMASEARRHYGATGTHIAAHAPEAFLRASADAGLLRIVQ